VRLSSLEKDLKKTNPKKEKRRAMPHSKECSLYPIRYSVPGRYDLALFGTIVRVQAGDEKSTELYIQLAEDFHLDPHGSRQEPFTTPHWLKIGELLEIAFKDLLEDPNFIQECLRLYRSTIKEYDENILATMFKK
jgi:hypothetical protein